MLKSLCPRHREPTTVTQSGTSVLAGSKLPSVRSLGPLPGRSWGALTSWAREGSEPWGCWEEGLDLAGRQ